MQILLEVEEVKKEVLSSISNPSKLVLPKEQLVLELQVEQFKMQDMVHSKHDVAFEEFERACDFY